MPNKNRLFETFIGISVALFFLVGRWGFARLSSDPTATNILLEPRYWIGMMLIVFLFMPIRRYKAKSGLTNTSLHWVTGTIVLFLLYMIVTSFWAPDSQIASIKANEQFLTIIAIMVLHRWSVLSGIEYIRTVFWITLFFISLFLAIYGFLSLLQASFDTYRISVLGGGPNAFGRNMGFLCLASLLIGFRTRQWLIAIVISILAYYLVILSGSRGATIATTIALIIFAILGRIQFSRLIGFIALIVTIGASVLIFTPFGNAISTILQYRVGDLLIEQRYVSGRNEIYEQAISLAEENLFVGIGLSGFSTFSTASYPHNLELEALTEGGIIGVLLIGVIIIVYIGQVVLHRGEIDPVTVAACVLAFIFAQFSGDLFDSRTVFIFMVLSFGKQ